MIDSGLRSNIIIDDDDEIDDEMENSNNNEFYDAKFNEINKSIQQTNELTKSFKRISPKNAKFSFSTINIKKAYINRCPWMRPYANDPRKSHHMTQATRGQTRALLRLSNEASYAYLSKFILKSRFVLTFDIRT